MNENIKILIVKLSAIGDVVQSTPILHALRRKFPKAHIAWAVEDQSSEILLNNPLIDEVIIFPKKKWKKRGFDLKNLQEFLEITNSLKEKNFDIAIDLQELFKSGLITYLSGAKRRIAHAGTREFAHIFINEKLPAHDNFDPNKLIIERYLEPAAYLGAPVDEVSFSIPPVSEETKKSVNKLLEQLNNEKEIVIFSPATIWATKHWIEDYWAELLAKLRPKYNIVFIGTEKDKKLIEKITASSKDDDYLSLAGKTSLLELIEIFNRAEYLIAPDTGPAHIANATQHPIIIMLFGPTGFRRTPPYGKKHIALSTELSCQPCFERKCPKTTNNIECMKKLTVDKILEFIK